MYLEIVGRIDMDMPLALGQQSSQMKELYHVGDQRGGERLGIDISTVSGDTKRLDEEFWASSQNRV